MKRRFAIVVLIASLLVAVALTIAACAPAPVGTSSSGSGATAPSTSSYAPPPVARVVQGVVEKEKIVERPVEKIVVAPQGQPAPYPSGADTSLANISTRGLVGSGNGVLIAGLVIGGTTPKPVLLRAVGPALAEFGVGGALLDPALRVVDGRGQTVAENDDWDAGGNVALLEATAARLGAFQFRRGSRDAAILTTLPPGNYTAVVNGVGDITGIALVEVYDADPDAATARTHKLVNIATRGQVISGDSVLIAGLVVTGPGPRTYLIRGIGPTLTRPPFNLSGALLDPFLEIYRGEILLRENDDWDAPSNGMPALREAATKTGAFALMETRDAQLRTGLDAVMLITLSPGSYTAKLSGFEGAMGVGLIEIYEMP